jgi:NADH-quinone oxidoreductase subunit M
MIPNILSWIVFVPLIGLLITLIVPKENVTAIRLIAVMSSLIALVLSLVLWLNFDASTSAMQFNENYQWIDVGFVQFNYDLGVDGLSLPMVLLTTIVMMLAMVASFGIKERVKEYFMWMLALQVGLTGVFVALDMLLFFLFFELTLIPMFFIIGIWGGKEREYASFKFLLYTGLGSIIMLLAFFALYFAGAQASGFTEVSFNMIRVGELLANPVTVDAVSFSTKTTIFLALFIAFAIKLPIFPFHTWLPDAHVQAPTPASMVLAGVLLKMGAYGLLRIGFGVLPDAAAHFATLIAVLGVINILYGALLALVQKDLKKLIAYSSISHMGIVLIGAASFTTVGMQGAIFQMVSHGFISALLFFMVGAIYERTHTRMLADLGGLSKSMPILSGFLLAAAMASVGLPGLSGFVSELMAFMGLFGAVPEVIPAATVIAVIGALGIILTAAYLLWAIQRTTFGHIRDEFTGLADARPIEYIPMIGLLGMSLLIGIYPLLLSDVINTTVIDLVSKIGG